VRNISSNRVSDKVDLLVAILLDNRCDLFRNIVCLSRNRLIRKGASLILQIEHVEIGAHFLLLVFLDLLRVLEQAVGDRLELLDVALVADNEEKDHFLHLVLIVLTAARIVDVIEGICVWFKRLYCLLRLSINVQELADTKD